MYQGIFSFNYQNDVDVFENSKIIIHSGIFFIHIMIDISGDADIATPYRNAFNLLINP